MRSGLACLSLVRFVVLSQLILLGVSGPAFAELCTDTSPTASGVCVVTASTLNDQSDVSGVFTPGAPAWTYPYTSAKISVNGSQKRYLTTDLDSAFNPYKFYQQLHIVGSTGRTTDTLTLSTRDHFDNNFNFVAAEQNADLHLHKLTLENVKVQSGNIRFFFDTSIAPAGGYQLNLIDAELVSDVTAGTPNPVFQIGKPLNFNVEGDSVLRSFTPDISTDMEFNVLPGATLTLIDARTGAALADSFLTRSGVDANFNIDGEMVFQRSNLTQQNGEININDGGVLRTLGSNSHLVVDEIYLKGTGTLKTGIGGSSIQAESIWADTRTFAGPSVIDIGASAPISTRIFTINGNLKLQNSSSTSVYGEINAGELLSARGNLVIDELVSLTVQNVTLGSTQTITLNDQSKMIIYDTRGFQTYLGTQQSFSGSNFEGGSITMNDDSSLFLHGFDPLGAGTGQSNADATINLNGTSNLRVLDGGTLAVGNGDTDITGAAGTTIRITEGSSIIGSDDLASADLIVDQTTLGVYGVLAPGFVGTGTVSDRIGTIQTDGRVAFTAFNGLIGLSEGDFDYGRYINQGLRGGRMAVDLNVLGGVSNDQLIYDDGDIRLGMLDRLTVSVINSPTASDLAGQSFTIIKSADNTGSGDIVYGARSGRDVSNINLVQDGSIPLMVDFETVDNQTNGRPDVTIQAYTLSKSAAVAKLGRYHRQASSNPVQTTNFTSAASKLINSSTPAALISSQITNASLSAAAANGHLEGYSSFQTVLLEEFDLVTDIVLNHASGVLRPTGNLKSSKMLSFAASPNEWGEYKNMAPFSLFGDPSTGDTGQGRSWFQAAYLQGHVDGDANLGDFDYDNSSFVAGVDFPLGDNLDGGVYVAYGKANMNEHDAINQDLSANTYHLGLYGQYRFENDLLLSGSLGYLYGKHKSRRANSNIIAGGAAVPDSTAKYASHGIQTGVELKKTIVLTEATSLMPTAGVDYMWVQQDAFDENGGGATGVGSSTYDHSVDASTYGSLAFNLGMETEHQFVFEDNKFIASLSGRYIFDATAEQDGFHEISAEGHDYVGQNRGAHAFQLGAGLAVKLQDNVDLGFGLMAAKTTHGHEIGGAGHIRYSW